MGNQPCFFDPSLCHAKSMLCSRGLATLPLRQRVERIENQSLVFNTFGYRYAGTIEDPCLQGWNVTFHICCQDLDGYVRGVFGVYGAATVRHVETYFLQGHDKFEVFGLQYISVSPEPAIKSIYKCFEMFVGMEVPDKVVMWYAPVEYYEWNPVVDDVGEIVSV